MKRCSTCKEVKPDDQFRCRNKRTGLLNGRCIPCQKDYARQHYVDNRSTYLERNARQHKEFLDEIRAIKEVPCKDCGMFYPYYVMDFDHIGDKEADINVLIARGQRKKALAEIAKCEVVCSNCHRKRTHKRILIKQGTMV